MKKGFTLIELLVVIGIIALLATIGNAYLQHAVKKARTTKAEAEISEIRKAIEALKLDSRIWPGHQTPDIVNSSGNNEICGPDNSGDDCASSLSDSSSGLIANDGGFSGWSGPYMRDLPDDPWGSEYFFDTDYSINTQGQPCGCGGICSNVVVIGSYGPDKEGVPNGASAYGCDDIILVIQR